MKMTEEIVKKNDIKKKANNLCSFSQETQVFPLTLE